MLGLHDRLRGSLDPKSIKQVADRLGLQTVGDLLNHFPRAYVWGGEVTDFRTLRPGEYAFLQATVRKVSWRRLRKGLDKTDVVVSDGRTDLPVTFFNKAKVRFKCKVGQPIALDGKVELFRQRLRLSEPEITEPDDALLTAGLVPVYPTRPKLRNGQIARSVRTILDQVGDLEDPLPEEVRRRYDLPPLREAYELVHRPETREDGERGLYRFRWEEALVLQVALAQRRAETERASTVPRPAQPGGIRAAFQRQLPFALTGGQRSVAETLLAEIGRPHPMHRLLEGEVGSGKTVVALLAMLAVIDTGGQAVLLAPTEVLATQHHRSLRELLGPLGRAGELDSGDVADIATRVELLTGSTSAATRRGILAAIADGTAGIVVGTHALLEESVVFHDLGLVVVDEQHRFGVEQRDMLRSRGRQPPHVLVMTATPIPRTVAMTVFGDLETSSLTELPKGRQPITSNVVPETLRPEWVGRMWQRIEEEIAAGHQAYVVCPRIGDPPGESSGGSTTVDGADVHDGADVDDGVMQPADEMPAEAGEQPPPRPAAAAVLEALPLLRAKLPERRVAVLHGRLPPDEKDAVMTAFSHGEIDVLLSTTVIEVGVDVPNATVMAILDADRFGISQLHQLRGRVGRGTAASLCLLHTRAGAGSTALRRLRKVAETTDGAELARLDLAARHEGDALGAAQSGGRRRLRLLQLSRDEKLIIDARSEATRIVQQDPGLETHRALAQALEAELDEDAAAFLEKG